MTTVSINFSIWWNAMANGIVILIFVAVSFLYRVCVCVCVQNEFLAYKLLGILWMTEEHVTITNMLLLLLLLFYFSFRILCKCKCLCVWFVMHISCVLDAIKVCSFLICRFERADWLVLVILSS